MMKRILARTGGAGPDHRVGRGPGGQGRRQPALHGHRRRVRPAGGPGDGALPQAQSRQGQALQDHPDQARREGSRRRQRQDRRPGAAHPGQRRHPRRLDLFPERHRLGPHRDRGQEARRDHERGHGPHHQPVALLRPRLVQHVARRLRHGRGRGQDPERQDRGGRLYRLPARQGQPGRVQAELRGQRGQGDRRDPHGRRRRGPGLHARSSSAPRTRSPTCSSSSCPPATTPRPWSRPTPPSACARPASS